MALDVAAAKRLGAKIGAAVQSTARSRLHPRRYCRGRPCIRTDMEFVAQHDVHQSATVPFLRSRIVEDNARHDGPGHCDLLPCRIARPARPAAYSASKHGLIAADPNHCPRDYSGEPYKSTRSALATWTPHRIAQHRVNLGTCWYFRGKRHARSLVNSTRIKRLIDVSRIHSCRPTMANRPRFAKASRTVHSGTAATCNLVAGHNLVLWAAKGRPIE